jgi:hypothetical protein
LLSYIILYYNSRAKTRTKYKQSHKPPIYNDLRNTFHFPRLKRVDSVVYTKFSTIGYLVSETENLVTVYADFSKGAYLLIFVDFYKRFMLYLFALVFCRLSAR